MFSADGGKSLDYTVIIWGYTFAIQKELISHRS